MSNDIALETQLADAAANDFAGTIDRVQARTNALGVSTRSFASAMTKAFTEATVGGKQFDDVLKSMGLQLSKLAVTQAFKPVANDIAKGFKQLLTTLLPDLFPKGRGDGPGGGGGGGNGGGCGCGCGGGGMSLAPQNQCCNCSQSSSDVLYGAFSSLFSGKLSPILPFAAGGVIGAPTYFPLASGGLGLAGEAGPEAIMPLSRGPDGRLGIAGGATQGGNITVQISTPDPGSFRRSEAYITGQIARAVARGQRSL
jgi:phage-related minor tail protein